MYLCICVVVYFTSDLLNLYDKKEERKNYLRLKNIKKSFLFVRSLDSGFLFCANLKHRKSMFKNLSGKVKHAPTRLGDADGWKNIIWHGHY